MKKKFYAGIVAGLLLVCAAGIASAVSYEENKVVTGITAEQKSAPKPATLLLFGTSMVGLMTLAGRNK